MNGIIEIERLRRRFGACDAVNDLSLAVPEGSVFALLGPNGAGKTTTIKVMMNIIRPSEGSVRVFDVDSRKLGPAQFREIGYVSENQEMPAAMTGTRLLDYCRAFYPSWSGDFAASLVRLLDVPLHTRIGSMSRGQRMKTALVSSLAYRPRLLVLDEPFAGLDPLVREEFMQGVLELTADERPWTVFIASHDVDEVERLADHVAMMNNGRLLLSEAAASLLDRFRQVEVIQQSSDNVPSSVPTTWLQFEQSGRRVRFFESAYRPQASEALVEQVFPGASVVAERMTLRSIFVALAKAGRNQEARRQLTADN